MSKHRSALHEASAIGEEVMDIVTKAAGRRLAQVLEYVHETEISPRESRIAELEAELARLKAKYGGAS